MASCSTIEEAKLPGGYLVTPRVPQGLAAAVEGLTREVIRHSPKDIYVFAAHHFEKLLHVRERCEVSSVEKSCPMSRRDEGGRALREMSRALKARELDRAIARTTGNTIDQVGWSLCQTAKVLKRHRSIFGEDCGRVTTDEVFLMASQKETDKARGKRSTRDNVTSSRRDDLWKTGTCKNERISSTEEPADSSGERTRSGPRIMTPIANISSGNVMLAKDIKTELRKNRMSSRERRNARASRHEDKSHRAERAESKVVKSNVKGVASSSKKSCSDRQKKVEGSIVDNERSRKNDQPTLTTSRKQRVGKSRDASLGSRSNDENSKTRTPGMDRVKDYVVGRFATTKSLEELQTLNYVEKVQEIIDETGPIIKEKIEQLKTGIIGGSEANSWFAKTRDNRAERVESRETSRKDSPEASSRLNSTGDALESRLTETRDLMESVSSSFSRPPRRSRSARSFRFENMRDETTVSEEWREDTFANRDNLLETRLSRTRELLENVSSSLSRPLRRSTSAKSSLRKHQETKDDENVSKDALRKRLDETRVLLRGISASFGKAGENISRHGATTIETEEESSNSENRAKGSLPAVKSNPTRNSSSASRSDSDNLVLPAISPEAPKSSKIREDLILPVLSPSATSTADSNKILDNNDDVALVNFGVSPDENFTPELPMENVSRDSLNVTPDFDSIPQRPDSLEPVETNAEHEAKIAAVECLEENVSGDSPPVATRESQELEARTPELDTLETELLEVETESFTPDDLESRLREIQKVERDVADAFGMKIMSEHRDSTSSVVEDELRKFEAKEKIEAIFDTESHGEDETAGQVVHEPVEVDGGKKVEKEASDVSPDEANDARENDESPIDIRQSDNLRGASPEPLNYTYVLTEGSPYDIPDTVTTVIIPERSVESPLSDRLRVEMEDDAEIRVSLIPGNETREVFFEDVANERAQSEVEATNSANSKSSKDDHHRESTTNREDSARSIDEEDISPKSLDPFGELIEPETIADSSSADDDFIREFEVMQIPRQDLGPINEEASEDLVDTRESPEKTVKNEQTSSTIIAEAREEFEAKDIAAVMEESKIVESDLSPEATRPDDVVSVSSNEAKESSVLDEVPISVKCENSIVDDDVEISSVTRTAESSNEVKETTLTDGLSLSLDPTRPFVPELNLDSLQDITVSSFKITEDDYDNQERGGSENTNSITDTLTSDENNRVNDNGLNVQPSATEFNAASFSSRSKLIALDESPRHEAEERTEVVEEIIVKSQVEAKEDICEKTSCYVTGTSREEERGERDAEVGEEESKEMLDSARPDVAMTNEKEETVSSIIEDSNEHREVNILQAEEEAEDAAIQEQDDVKITNDSDDDNKVEIADRKDEAIITSKEEDPEAQNAATKNEDVVEILKIDQLDKSNSPRAEEEITATEISNENENLEIVKFDEKEEIPSGSEKEEIARTEVTNEKENAETEKEEEITVTEVSNENESVEIVKFNEKEEIPSEIDKEEIARTDVKNENENAETEKEEEITPRSENEKNITMEDSKKVESGDIEAVGKDEKILPKTMEEDISETKKRRISDEDIDTKDADIENTEGKSELNGTGDQARSGSLEDENRELDIAISDKRDDASSGKDIQSDENDDRGKTEVTVEDLRKSEDLDEKVSKNISQVKLDSTASERAEDVFDQEISSRELETDDVPEESYVEDETPLAFSRSASQCTTRRVSSGNLAKLREDPSLDWYEENVGEDYEDGTSENDEVLSRVNFLDIDKNMTIEKSGEDGIGRNTSDSLRDASNEINETRTTKDSNKEYHIYVPDVNANADNSTTESSSTLDSAVTKIQAGVRGFLARRRLQRGQQKRSSTLNSIPSIQDSEVIVPQRTDDRDREASGDEEDPGVEESLLSSPKFSMDNDIASDPTKIRSNFCGYEARKRLRRENAVQRTTFSLDKSFAANGLQHTGEFHDCIALPIHDIDICREASEVRKTAIDDIEKIEKNFNDENRDVGELVSEENERSIDVEHEESPGSPKTSITLDPGRLFFGSSSKPFIQFETRPSISQLVDLVALTKDDASLQTGYLNFITSVEDTETLIDPIPLDTNERHAEEPNSSECLMEPLALSDPPIGVIIEEVESSDAETFAKPDDDQTLASAKWSLAPEEIEDTPEPASPSMEHHRESGNTSNGSRIQENESGSSPVGGEDKRLKEPETSLENVTSVSDVQDSGSRIQEEESESSRVRGEDKRSKEPETSLENVTSVLDVQDSAHPEKLEENVGPQMESMINYIMLPGKASLTQEKHFLGPESSVDSMECPEVRDKEKNTSGTSDLSVGASTKNVTGEATQRISSGEQDSQLADERIESPVTMIQIAPERSESLKQNDHSDNDDDKVTSNVEQSSPKTDEK